MHFNCAGIIYLKGKAHIVQKFFSLIDIFSLASNYNLSWMLFSCWGEFFYEPAHWWQLVWLEREAQKERETISQRMRVGSSQFLLVPCNASTQPSQDQIRAIRVCPGGRGCTLTCDINCRGLGTLFHQRTIIAEIVSFQIYCDYLTRESALNVSNYCHFSC